MTVRYLRPDLEPEVEFLDGLYCPVDFLILDEEEQQ